jgi:hypothetical protein
MQSFEFANPRNAGLRRWSTVAILLAATLSACGGGSGVSMSSGTSTTGGTSTTTACTAATCGSAVMTMTDAVGDFLTYQVGISSLQLKKADGTLVETLPMSSTADFTQLINLSEVISARQIPPGEYVAAQVTVDYTHAVIMVDDGTGTGVAVSPVDSSGAALTTLTLTVQLDNKNHLNISAGKVGRLAFDFNLLASNIVDLNAKTVTVSPVLVASVVPPDTKQIRVRGDLGSVDTTANTYTVQIEPFHEHGDDNQNPITVHVTDTTTYEINGTPSSGAAGLAALAALPANSITAAYGSLQSSDQAFTATRVLAGTSLEGGGMDHLLGSVVARSGNTLTVHGAHVEDHDQGDDHDDHGHYYAGNTTVTIADATTVTAQGQALATPAHTTAEISVGSLIDVFGTAGSTSNNSGPGNNPASGGTFDATAGHVRLNLTAVKGTVNSVGANQVSVHLSSIDRQAVSLFNFAGTGTLGADSNPAQYVVATGALDLTAIAAGNSLLAIGTVAPFGSSPPDFKAVTLALGAMPDMDDNDDDNNRGKGAQMDIDWGNNGTTAPFSSESATALVLDAHNTSIGGHHRIQVDPSDIDITQLASDPSIVAASSGGTLFAITGRHGRATDNFGNFADFETALAADLNGTTTALRLTADGTYDAASNTFTARRIVVLLSN